MQSETRTAGLIIGAGVLAWLGWTAIQQQWWARVRAERTALTYAEAVYRLDSAALERITASGSAHNSLCAGRWSLSRLWGDDAHFRVVRRLLWRDTLEYHIRSKAAPTTGPGTFVFSIALARPDKVVGYHVPQLRDSAAAAGFWHCTGWLDWPRVRQPPS